MPSPLRSPKNLADWEELDYFRRRRLFRGLWRSLVWGALVVSCLGVGWTLWAGKHTVYQAGPLATSHAMFNQNCGLCHTEAFPTFSRLWTNDPSVRAVPDSACQQCHAGPRHHECAAQRACASCHHEHRGQAALARVADNQCTSCHADLKCDDGKATDYERHVTRFAEGSHPEFRLWRDGEATDPGKLNFNHKVHLQGVLDLDRKQLEQQREALRKAGAVDCGDVSKVERDKRQLDCASCHEMDPEGRFMRPVNFDRHCKECHPLSVQLVGDFAKPLRDLACEFGTTPAPHPRPGETAEVVRAALRDRLTRFILAKRNKPLLGKEESEELPRPLPGWIRAEPVPPREFAWVNRQLEQVERVVFDGGGGCRYCHQEKTTPQTRRGGLPEFEKPGLLGTNERPWFQHGIFRHDTHKMLTCTECHDAAGSTSAKDVLMPRVGKCQQCHHEGGGARADCVECHVYHDPGLKRQFRGGEKIDRFFRK